MYLNVNRLKYLQIVTRRCNKNVKSQMTHYYTNLTARLYYTILIRLNTTAGIGTIPLLSNLMIQPLQLKSQILLLSMNCDTTWYTTIYSGVQYVWNQLKRQSNVLFVLRCIAIRVMIGVNQIHVHSVDSNLICLLQMSQNQNQNRNQAMNLWTWATLNMSMDCFHSQLYVHTIRYETITQDRQGLIIL